ncbi:hydroxyproline dehydrogenase-like [Trachypithecus francoisi]|uniref:hydroxyproline dehydrogenase-like n=1 Tax=Trachypithecus francoisi TaxID=54180 RepID=UPI00141B1ABD|nr:hydroxyproline dehydrogenase-like [Trachypithecus francoisi]
MLRTCYLLCSQAGPLTRGWQPLSFDGGAFQLKGTGELTRALLVLRLCAWPPLVTHGLMLQAWSQGLLLGSRLSGAFLRASVYGQFVAGETAEEVRGCVRQLRTLSLRPLLAALSGLAAPTQWAGCGSWGLVEAAGLPAAPSHSRPIGLAHRD